MIGRRRRVAPATWLAATVLTCASLAAQAPAPAWRAATLKSFDLVWQTINDTYFDPSFGGLDWAAIGRASRTEVEQAPSPEAARIVMRTMLGRLGQSHFGILSAAPESDSPSGPAVVPIDVRIGPSGAIVTGVDARATASHADVVRGDRLVSIDGHRVEDWIRSASGEDERSRNLDAWRKVSVALHGAEGSQADLVVRDAAGHDRDVRLARLSPPGRPIALGNLPPLNVSIQAGSTETPAGRRVGVFAFSLWMTTVGEPFAAWIDTYRDASGLIIDLRGNPGGLADMMRGIAGQVLDAPLVIGRMHTRAAELEFRANPRLSTSDGRRVTPYAGPLAILVDELTGSASECFAAGLQSLGRARIFGRPTMGQALPASTLQLPDGDVLMYAIGDFVTSTGVRVEGAGITPDEIVPLTVASFANGQDPVLRAALAWLDRVAR